MSLGRYQPTAAFTLLAVCWWIGISWCDSTWRSRVEMSAAAVHRDCIERHELTVANYREALTSCAGEQRDYIARHAVKVLGIGVEWLVPFIQMLPFLLLPWATRRSRMTQGGHRRMTRCLLLIAVSAAAGLTAGAPSANPPVGKATVIPLLPPGPGNPRNTEGSFVTLRDGRVLFAYTRFTGGTGDHDSAAIVGRYSSNGGRTWTDRDEPLVAGEGAMNVMSVSLLRLQDGRIALFYLRKNSVTDCLPCMRYSRDEARTWSEHPVCVPAEGYYVLNNDRAVQLRSGRIVLPVAHHPPAPGGKFGSRGVAMAFLSDDGGGTWRSSRTKLESAAADRAGFQEPGVVELKDGRLMMFIRTQLGSQYLSYSADGGESWSEARPSQIASPLSPASIKRIPGTGDLLMVWNDHASAGEVFLATATSGGKRTPLTLAVSRDDGKTWQHKQDLLADPEGWYCYTAIHFVRNRVLLAFAAGGSGLPHLSRTSLALVDVKRLYR
jgi:hypothetical protein